MAAPMVRDALACMTGCDSGEALLRHYVRKSSHLDSDRDKTDLVVSFLYRKKVQQYEGEDDPAAHFEAYLTRLLAECPQPAYTEDVERLVMAFSLLRNQAGELKQFEQIVESGIREKARRYKAELREGIFHPKALAI